VKRLALALALALAMGVGASACSSPSDEALHESLEPLPRGAVSTSSTPTTAPPPTTGPADACNPQASLELQPNVPTPTVQALRDRGYLVVGVDQGTRGWGFRDPSDGHLKGLEVELLRRIALELFGDAKEERIKFKTLNTAQRIAAVQNGTVDMVASLLTATCERWKLVDFSTVYFVANQALLVNQQSTIHSVDDLAGRRVCATQGSTSIAHIAEIAPKAILHPVEARSDCVVALQEGDVDAITSDDTILRSFRNRDKVPLTRIVDLPASEAEDEPYAIAITKHHEDLVWFVNDVLQEMRDDGSLLELYLAWIVQSGEAPPPVPQATYR
jgi:polar amino acid transport system substrate-binding protein